MGLKMWLRGQSWCWWSGSHWLSCKTCFALYFTKFIIYHIILSLRAMKLWLRSQKMEQILFFGRSHLWHYLPSLWGSCWLGLQQYWRLSSMPTQMSSDLEKITHLMFSLWMKRTLIQMLRNNGQAFHASVARKKYPRQYHWKSLKVLSMFSGCNKH